MQNFLREQEENVHGVNMVGELATFLYDFSKKESISVDIMRLLNQLLQTLTEFCTGNYRNCEIIFHANVVSVINYVLQIDIKNIRPVKTCENISSIVADADTSTNRKSAKDYVQLRKLALNVKVSAVELLDALLEKISTKTFKLSQQIAEGLDINALHWSMLDFYELKGDQDLIRLEVDDDACRALFDCYKIIMHLVDIKIAPLETLSELTFIRLLIKY